MIFSREGYNPWITALTIEVTKARNPMELKARDGRHCWPPFSGMKTNGATGVDLRKKGADDV